MKYSKAKTNDLINFKVSKIELDLVDNLIKEIRLLSSDDNVIKITHDYSQLLIHENTKPTYKDLYVMKATDGMGASVCKEFETKNEAIEFCKNANYFDEVIEKITVQSND